MTRPQLMRYGIPGAIGGIGVILVLMPNSAVVVAGGGCWLVASLWIGAVIFSRLKISGRSDREREEDARTYYSLHGHWPSERPLQPPAGETPVTVPRVESSPSVKPVPHRRAEDRPRRRPSDLRRPRRPD